MVNSFMNRLKKMIRSLFPVTVVNFLKLFHQYGLRMSDWGKVVIGVRGKTPKDKVILWMSILAAPVTSLSKLSRWQYPKLLFDMNATINGGLQFSCKAKTDQLYQITPGSQKGVLNALRRHLFSGATFVDAGANIGFFTLTGSKIVGSQGKVVSIEMMPATAEKLREHISLNQLSNVTLIENALSNKGGELMVGRHPIGSAGQATVLGNEPTSGEFVEYSVTTTTLDDVANRLKTIDLMKIDVEGYEEAAFRGGREMLSRTKAVILEKWPGDERGEAAVKVLQQAGFVLQQIDSCNVLGLRE